MRTLLARTLIGVAVAAGFASALPAQTDEVKQKLEEFERRLQQLEAQQAASAETEEKTEDPMTVQVEELRRQLDILAEEIEKIRSGEEEVALTEQQAQAFGLGPAAASIYEKKQGASIAGYGEMLYENFDSENESGAAVGRASELDFLRAIIYYGYRFNDKFIFNSEIEVEHADEISVEFAYIDYLAGQHFNLRGGMVLVPMGLVNEFHEPNVFLGARRPETETRIIPSTWRENGAGFFGSAGPVSYRAYVINGLDASGFSSDGIRGGRQKGAEALATDLAFVGRVDVNPTPGVFFGGSLYVGDSGQGQFGVDGRQLGVRTTIGEVHGQLQIRGFDLRGLYAQADVDDAAQLSVALGRGPDSPIAERMRGGYLQFGYNLLSQSSEKSQLTPYYRFEKVDTQNRVPAGFLRDLARDRTFHTFGLEFKPIYNVVIKSDYQWAGNLARTGVNQFNIALGYSF